MIKQVVPLFLWISLGLYCVMAATTEVPKECAVGTPDYNETLCSETCTKEVHMNESYCSNFTKATETTQPQPQPQQQQETHNPVAMPEVNSPPTVTKNGDLPNPNEMGAKAIDAMSSAVSLQSSLLFSVLSFLLCYSLI